MRQDSVLEAQERNLRTRRGGRQGKARTRGIHRNILQVLKERILRLIAILASGTRQDTLHLRVRQVDERLNFLEDNWPEDKRSVLPGIRSWSAEIYGDPVSDAESESLCSTVTYHSKQTEEEENLEEGEFRGSRDPGLRQNSFVERLVARGLVLETRPGVYRFNSAHNPLVQSTHLQVVVPDLPAQLRGGSRVGGSATSSSQAAPKIQPKARPKPPPLAPTAKYRAKAKAAPSSSSRPDVEVVEETIDLEIQVAQPIESVWGLEVFGLTRKVAEGPVLILDYHNVLDKVVLSLRSYLRNQNNGSLHPRVAQVCADILGNPFKSVLVCSYCHREDTRQNVRRACVNQNLFTGVLLTDKPTGPTGKLACISAVLDQELLQSRRVYLIDDSPDVLQEVSTQSSIVAVGIQLRRANYWRHHQVHYEYHLFAAIEHVLRLEQQYR